MHGDGFDAPVLNERDGVQQSQELISSTRWENCPLFGCCQIRLARRNEQLGRIQSGISYSSGRGKRVLVVALSSILLALPLAFRKGSSL